MNKEQLVKIVDEVAEGLLEGGPGSGRYPAGSGKNPTTDDNVGDKKMEPTIGGSTPAEREAHSKNAGADHFTKIAFKADRAARDTPLGHSQKVKRHKEAIKLLRDAADKGDEKYQATNESRIRVHERLLKQAVEYRDR